MKFGANRSRMYDAQKTAQVRWDQTTDFWADGAAEEFKEQFWEPLDRMTTDVLRGVDQLSVLLTQVRQECAFGE